MSYGNQWIMLCGLWLLSSCTTQYVTQEAPMDGTDASEQNGVLTESNDEDAADQPWDEPMIDGLEAGWGRSDLSCTEESDCNSNEVCISGQCQIDRCSAVGYESIPPLGDSFLFYADREVAVFDGDDDDGKYFVDLFSPHGTATGYDGSIRAPSGRLNDIASGDFLGDGMERYAGVATADRGWQLILLDDEYSIELTLSFEPIALDAGDLDGDGRAELVVMGSNQVHTCDLVDELCEGAETDKTLVDVGVADVDGDAIPEPVLLQEHEGEWSIWVHNLDAERTGQPMSYETQLTHAQIERVSAGDIDGDGQAEVILLDDKGFFGMRDDHLFIYTMGEEENEFELLQEVSVDYGRIVDLAVGDTDANGVAEIVLLDSHDKVLSYAMDGEDLVQIGEREIGTTGDPQFIALGDHDGDSPRAELVAGPEPVTGAQVPVVLIYLPPFSVKYSSGFSYAGYGLGETYSETYTDTVSLSINADVGVNADFLGLFKTSFSEKVAWKTSETLGETSSMSTGGRSNLRSDPETFGKHYGAVVVSWGCFHAYTYEIVDPNDHYDADGEPIVMTVPVDGGTAMLSTNRYNAMAEQVGDLPHMPVPYTVGEPSTYPSTPETIYGDPIPEDAYLFPNLTWYEVSDVGYVGWFNSLGDSSSQTNTHGMDAGVSAKVTVAGIAVGAGFTAGWGKGYSLSMGNTALFFGGIPPFVDDAETHTDEYVDNFYRVAPVNYRHAYIDSTGTESSFFVSTYVIDQ